MSSPTQVLDIEALPASRPITPSVNEEKKALPSDRRHSMDDEEEEDEDEDGYPIGKTGYSIEQQATHWDSKWGALGKVFAFLIRHGCEARGIQPVALQDREKVTPLSYLIQTTLFATLNANILTISAGVLGPELFNLPLKSCVATILVFNAIAVLPVAYFATFGPKLGLRQMVLSRYTFGRWPNLVPAVLNVCTAVGFLSLTSILGGQLLSLASGGTLSWSLGIVLVGLIGILPSFLGLRAIHLYSLSILPISLIIHIAIVGLSAPSLAYVSEGERVMNATTTAGSVLGFGSTIIGFAATYASFASDFTTYLPPNTSAPILASCVWIGLFAPLVLLQILGAAFYLVAMALPSWDQALEANGVAGLVAAAVGSGAGGKCLLVLSALIVTGNGSCTVYSIGLSAQAAAPWLMLIPRYFLALLVTFVYVPIALALSSHFSSYLSNFLYILSYWISLYVAPLAWENILFRNPITVGQGGTYDLTGWSDKKKLPIGYAAIASWVVGVPAVTAGISQLWWVGWAAARIEGGKGDIGFILGFSACSLVFIPARYIERRYIGR
ncbi:60s ribosomal protein L34 [Phaffia rhodozyma]|uniref:60s ribosomal protein L34 n=1 Tax=Phaffia rhodozyma TaxID=264483 RepID=A0A0F7SXS2_PHARH|nr:60s ribosomal protein L34 [Phaffia rhodozyma]